MATANLSATRPLSLEQLIALSEEIAALARSGVPLDQGLAALGRELPGRLGRVSQELSNELAAGVPLDQVVARAGVQFPPGYQALIAAGLRAGNLPGVLQGMLQLARKTGEIRRQVLLATINPLLVVVMGYLLFCFWLIKLAPVYLAMAEEWDIPVGWARAICNGLTQTMPVWFWVMPLLFVGLVLWSWRRTASGMGEWSLLDLPTLGIVRGIGQMRRAGQHASLCEQLAILLEHGLPLAEALQVISGTLTSRPLARATQEFAEHLSRGQAARPSRPFPPLLACILLDSQNGQALISNLRQMSLNYQDEVRRRSAWLGTWVPALLTLAFGGGLVTFHVLVMLGPWIALMRKMAELNP